MNREQDSNLQPVPFKTHTNPRTGIDGQSVSEWTTSFQFSDGQYTRCIIGYIIITYMIIAFQKCWAFNLFHAAVIDVHSWFDLICLHAWFDLILFNTIFDFEMIWLFELDGAGVSASGWRSGGPRFQSHPRLTSQSCSRYHLNQLGSKAASESTFDPKLIDSRILAGYQFIDYFFTWEMHDLIWSQAGFYLIASMIWSVNMQDLIWLHAWFDFNYFV